ncbi:Hypothetical predicted protein [Pelobates cultripes]|nr:Hypothetical predicted protein [Pelobates cultripes]
MANMNLVIVCRIKDGQQKSTWIQWRYPPMDAEEVQSEREMQGDERECTSWQRSRVEKLQQERQFVRGNKPTVTAKRVKDLTQRQISLIKTTLQQSKPKCLIQLLFSPRCSKHLSPPAANGILATVTAVQTQAPVFVEHFFPVSWLVKWPQHLTSAAVYRYYVEQPLHCAQESGRDTTSR